MTQRHELRWAGVAVLSEVSLIAGVLRASGSMAREHRPEAARMAMPQT